MFYLVASRDYITSQFYGGWEVVVRWIELGTRKSTITIPSTETKTSEKWNIRKTKVNPQTLPCKRSCDNKIQLDYSAKFQSRRDTKRFFQGDTMRKGSSLSMTLYSKKGDTCGRRKRGENCLRSTINR